MATISASIVHVSKWEHIPPLSSWLLLGMCPAEEFPFYCLFLPHVVWGRGDGQLYPGKREKLVFPTYTEEGEGLILLGEQCCNPLGSP